MKSIVASGPVIIKDGKLLVSKKFKKEFYKIPGGTVEEGETLEQCCKREAKEEANAEIEIFEQLHTLILNKNPETQERMNISVYNFKAELKNPDKLKAAEGHEIAWLDIKDLKEGKYSLSPNIKNLIEKGDIK